MCPGERQVLVNLEEAGKVVNEARMKGGRDGRERRKEKRKKNSRRKQFCVLKAAGVAFAPRPQDAAWRREAALLRPGALPCLAHRLPSLGSGLGTPGPSLRRGTTGEGLGDTGILNSPPCTKTFAIPCLTLPSQTEKRMPRASLRVLVCS